MASMHQAVSAFRGFITLCLAATRPTAGPADPLGAELEDLQRSQEALQRRVEELTGALARANTSIDQLTHMLSHDLRAPLRSVTGFLGLVKLQGNDVLTERSREHLRWVERGTEDMLGMIDGLLHLSRLRHQELAMRPLDVGTLVQEARRKLGRTWEEAGAALAVATPHRILADPNLLTEAIEHVLGNCVRYRCHDVPLQIDVSSHPIDGAQVEVAIADNGTGVLPDMRENLFAPFRRGIAPNEDDRALGLGLTIARAVAERHGGSVWLESLGRDQGTTVRFRLPAAQ